MKKYSTPWSLNTTANANANVNANAMQSLELLAASGRLNAT
jgi:hypothetical protein